MWKDCRQFTVLSGGGGAFRRKPGHFRAEGPFKEDTGTLVLSLLSDSQSARIEQTSWALHLGHDILCHHKPKATKSSECGPKALKPEPK